MQQKFNLADRRRQQAVSPADAVRIITERIEQAQTDIAPTYRQWCDLGFALAQGLGEQGRNYYHRLSRFYERYNHHEADKQYTACLRSSGRGITFNTFFYLAKRAGIDISVRPSDCAGTAKSAESRLPRCHVATLPHPHVVATTNPTPPPVASLPVLPDDVYASLPGLLAQVVECALSAADRDMLLLGSLTCLSSCLTHVSGTYGQRQVWPNLFLFVTAPASAGKGRLTLCRHLVDLIHIDLRKRNKQEWEVYRRAKAKYDAAKRKGDADEPCQPPVRMLFIPANSSSTALFQTLNDNEGQALMFETEGDTLTTTFRSEHGNYSDGFRKAYHHEAITYNRRKDREYVEIASPRLSVLLSGTPRQVSALIPDAENGLHSRFLYYVLPLQPVWNDVFARSEDGTIDQRFLRLGARFFAFYNRLQKGPFLRFGLTAGQQAEFNAFFASLQDDGLSRYGDDILPTVRRLGLSAFRIAMSLSVLRLMDADSEAPLPTDLTCADADFRTVLSMMPVLLHHAGEVHRLLTGDADPPSAAKPASGAQPLVEQRRQERIDQLLQALPREFDRTTYLNQATRLGIPQRTADRYLSDFCKYNLLTRSELGLYRKAGDE